MLRRRWHHFAVASSFAAVAFMPSFAAGQGVKMPHAPVSTTIGDITSMRSSYVEAYNSKESKTLAGFYAPDAVVISPTGVRMTGPAIGKYFADSASTFGHLDLASHGIKVYGTIAVDMGTATERRLSGGDLVSEYLAVLRHDVKGWHVEYLANVPVTKGM
ncbi:MAG: nuclear transport factor 2 family protein [Gemmatimonadales bacterium]